MAKRAKKTTRTMTEGEANRLVQRALAHIMATVEWDWSGWNSGDFTEAEWAWIRDNLPGNIHLQGPLIKAPKLTIAMEEDDEEG